MKKRTIIILIVVVLIMSIFTVGGVVLNRAFDKDANIITTAYDKDGDVVLPDLPIPTGDLNASSTVALPNLHDSSHGFTCTGLAYDAKNDLFLVGDIGALLPGGTIASQIVRMSSDFSTVLGTIDIGSIFSGMGDVQGITLDADGSIWFCAPSENMVRHISADGSSIGSFSITQPTGIAYQSSNDSLWVLNYNNKIYHVTKDGTIGETYDFAYTDTLDQCFLDEERGYLYITAGTNYSGRNNVYLFNTSTHEQSIACTVDSYSVEGICITESEMVIVNDGYYHSATVAVNQANIYTLR